MHNRILEMLIRRYDRRIMNNVQRGDYVECMIATALGADWRLAAGSPMLWHPVVESKADGLVVGSMSSLVTGWSARIDRDRDGR